MSLATKKPIFLTPTGESIPSPFYPTPTGQPINTNSIIDNLSSKIKSFDINSVINSLSTTLKTTQNITPASVVQKFATSIGNPTGNETEDKGIFNWSDPRYQNIKTLAQVPSTMLGSFLIQPAWNFLSSSAELVTGKPLSKLKIPALTKDMGNFVDASSYQQKYVSAIENGM